MQSSTKWILRTIGAAVLLMPVVVYIVIWSVFRAERTREERKTAALIANFHRLYNASDFDGICHLAYKCEERPKIKEDWQLALDDTRASGGAFRQTQRFDFTFTIEPRSLKADVVSSFDKGEIREIFTLKDFEGPLKIVTYQRVFRP